MSVCIMLVALLSMHIHIYTYTHTHIYTCLNVCLHRACCAVVFNDNTQAGVYIGTHTHTHTYICIYTRKNLMHTQASNAQKDNFGVCRYCVMCPVVVTGLCARCWL